MKKKVSVLLSAALLVLQLPHAAAGVEPENLTDTEIPRKNANLVDPTVQNGFTYLCINNNLTLSYQINAADGTVSWYVPDTYEKFLLNKNPSEFGFEGFELSPPRDQVHPFSFTAESGKTYVIQARLRNNSESGIIPYIGASMNNSWSSKTVVGTNEYQKTGMALDRDGWQDFKCSITLPENYVENTSNGVYANRVYLGLGQEMEKGTGFLVDVSGKDSFYFAEEQAYQLNLLTDGKTLYEGGGELTLTAELKNQIGILGGLSQEFDWYALKGDRSGLASGIQLTETDGSKTVCVTWNDTLPEGDYLIVARAKKYDMVRTFRFTIAKESLEDAINTIPENIIPDTSKEMGEKYLQYNASQVSRTYPVVDGKQCLEFSAKDQNLAFVPDTKSGYFGGFAINTPSKPLAFQAEAGKTYVIRANVKKVPERGESRFGAAMNDTWNVLNVIKTNEYPEGMLLTDAWQDFSATLTLPKNYNSSAMGIYADEVYFGLATGTVNGGFYVDISEKDSIYFAEEKPVLVRLSCEKRDQLSAGDVIEIQATVSNQIGIGGTLSQELSWYCLNDDHTETVQGVEIVPKENGAVLRVNRTDGLDQGLTVVAVSKQYGLVSEISPLKAGHKRFYVSPDGDDAAAGTKNNPLKTLAGARDRIRVYRSQDDTPAIEVIFSEGVYRFSETVSFSAKDSGTETAPVIYRAADGERVVFSGAVELDLSNAELVSDPEILERLPESARGKTVVTAISDFPYQIDQNELAPTAQQLCGYWEYPELYADGKAQTLAQWPNGEANYATWTYQSDTAFGYSDQAPDRWVNAADWWVGGYLMWDYQYIRLPGKSVNPENRTIQVETDSIFYPKEGRKDLTHRWKAFNLLEELDVPGEWYLDTDSMKLYYYPPVDFGNCSFEMSALKNSMIRMQNTDYVTFRGIEFTKTRGNGIDLVDVEHVMVQDCAFTDIGVNAIDMSGSKQAETDRDYWQRQDIDAAYNCEISDCTFYEIGGHAVILDGGNVDTLRPGRNVIKNSFFSRCAQKIRNYDTILIHGCGNEVTHNSISRTPFQAIRFYGNDHKISYNEIYHVRQESDDSGAIYCGRNSVQRGTVISYNYLHDLLSTQELNFKHLPAIYLDDGQCGITAEYNIIQNAEFDIYTNGTDHLYQKNIIADMAQKHLYFRTRFLSNAAACNSNTEQSKFAGYIANPELYYQAYPNLKTIVESDSLAGTYAVSLYALNQIRNNLCVRAGSNEVGPYVKNISGNQELDAFYDFVDPEHLDYRIKNSSAYADMGVLTEDFDLEQIGVVSDNRLTEQPVRLLSPGAGEKISANQFHFTWYETPGATTYTIEVARDAEFLNVVTEQEVFYAYADLELPNPDGSEYFWRVTAHNKSREFSSDWQSETRSFQNGEKLTAEAELSEDGTLSLTLTNHYSKDGMKVWSYLAEYDGNGSLLAAQLTVNYLSYQIPMNVTGAKPRLKYPEQAKTVLLYCWDEAQKPYITPKLLRSAV